MNWEKIDRFSDYFLVFLTFIAVLDIGFQVYKNKDVLWKMKKKTKKI